MSATLVAQDRSDRRISAAVLGLIAQRRLTVTKVANAIGLSRTTLYNRVNNERPWEADEVDRLARYFEVTRDSLYEGRVEFRQGPSPEAREAIATLQLPGARSSTDRASDYGSVVGPFGRAFPHRHGRRRTDRSPLRPTHLRIVASHDAESIPA